MNRNPNRALFLALALVSIALLALLLYLAPGTGSPARAAAVDSIIKVPDDYTSIQEAIDAAEAGDTILVAEGNYTENLRITLPITLSGGWHTSWISNTWGDSVIDGGQNGRVISITCATSDTVVTIDGFTIRNGDATGLTGLELPELPRWGEAILPSVEGFLRDPSQGGTSDPAATEGLDPMSPTEQLAGLRADLASVAARGLYPGGEAAYQAMLERLELRTAQAEEAVAKANAPPAAPEDRPQQGDGQGGGIYSWKASPHLLNNIFLGNVATQDGTGWGGGVYVSYAAPGGVYLSGNYFSENVASDSGTGVGGAMALYVAPGAVIEGNQLMFNWGSGYGTGMGGGAAVYASPDVVFEGNLVQGNMATLFGGGQGGGLHVAESPGTSIAYNTIQENVASGFGEVEEGSGGGIYVLDSSDVVVEGNSITGNTGLDAGIVGASIGGAGGLMVDKSLNATVQGNTFEANTGNAAWVAYAGTAGGLHVFNSEGALVSGNTIRSNLAALNGGGGAGAMLVSYSYDVLVTDNEVTGNWGIMFAPSGPGSGGGGGITLFKNYSTTVSANTMQENTGIVFQGGDCYGGGFWASDVSEGAQITGNDITSNIACLDNEYGLAGGGGGWVGDHSEGVVVAGNTFEDNLAGLKALGSRGGGLMLRNTIGSQVLGNRFVDNVAGMGRDGHGGGILLDSFFDLSRSATVDGNLFLNNKASADPDAELSSGGAAHAWIVLDGLWFTNNVLVGNQATDTGGLWMESAEHAHVVNNTLVDNADVGMFASVVTTHTTDVEFVNNIVVSHSVGISVSPGATTTVSYNLWEAVGTEVTGTGTISHTHDVYGDPAFADPVNDDYHLTIGSAAIDAGDPAGVPPAPDDDADGVVRPQGSAVDLGAYEWQGYWQYLPFLVNHRRPGTGWVAGNAVDGYGTIIHTTNSGATWVRQGTAGEIPDANLGGTAAIDDQNAWVVGDQGTILRTRDGGRTWELQEVPAEVFDADLCGVYAVDGETAWAGGAMEGTNTGVILHTTDGGQTWTEQGQNLALESWLCGVYASDAEHAWAVGDKRPGNEYATIVRTSDGGTTWEELPCPPQQAGLNPALISIHGVDANTLWAVGNAQALLSEDGGNTWTDRQPPSGFLDINGVAALDRDSVWVVVDNGGIFRSDDRGLSWEKQTIADGLGGDYVLRISAVDGQTAWAVTAPDPRYPSNPGHVLHTVDGGQTWITQTTPVSPAFWGVSFVR